MRKFGTLLFVLLFVVACGSNENPADVNGDTVGDVAGDVIGDTGSDIAGDTGRDVATTDQVGDTVNPDSVGDTQGDAAQDVAGDTTGDVTGDATPDFDAIPAQEYPPRELPFQFTRPAVGDPIPEADVTAFTRTVASAYKQIGYFRWLLRTSTGVDHTTGMDDYLAWYNDVAAIKSGSTVTFNHFGGEHNMWIPGSMVLTSVLNGYLLTGDWEMARLTEQYCKGLTAVVKGFVYNESDPAPMLMARAILPMDQSLTLDADFWKDDGRVKVVDFHEAHFTKTEWNAKTFEWPTNPTWGDVWVTNMRSKDDVRSISRTTTWLPYLVADAKDQWVKDACQETLDTMVAFQKDIVDSGYNIRTKGPDGVAYIIPCEEQDLASYVCYTGMDPLNECCQRLSADMIGYGERRTNDCGTGFGSVYDGFAAVTHYYNIPIIWDYHMAALGNSLVKRQYRDAWYLLKGMQIRIDSYMHPVEGEPGTDDASWPSDMAVLLVQAASMGLPLTDFEARHVEKYFSQAAAYFETWTYWDLWSDLVPDGKYAVRPPDSADAVDIEAFAILFEYCNSPFKNPDGAQFVDCAVLADPTTW